MTESPGEALDEFEEQLGRKQRLKFIVGIALGVLVVAAAVVVYLLWPKQPDPRCKQSDVQAFLKNGEIPAEAVHQVCRLPEPLAKALKGCLALPPYQRKLIVYKATVDHPELFTPVCRHLRKALREALPRPPDEQSATFLKRCDLAGTGIRTPSKLTTVPLHRILLAMAVYNALHRSDPKWAVRLARRMMAAATPVKAPDRRLRRLRPLKVPRKP